MSTLALEPYLAKARKTKHKQPSSLPRLLTILNVSEDQIQKSLSFHIDTCIWQITNDEMISRVK